MVVVGVLVRAVLADDARHQPCSTVRVLGRDSVRVCHAPHHVERIIAYCRLQAKPVADFRRISVAVVGDESLAPSVGDTDRPALRVGMGKTGTSLLRLFAPKPVVTEAPPAEESKGAFPQAELSNDAARSQVRHLAFAS